MADKRQRQRAGFDRKQLMQRIATSAPPGIDGELRRWKDRQEAIEAGEDDDTEPDAPAPPPPSRKVRASTFNQFKPGTRQPATATAKVTGELPWWAKTPQGEMTKAAEQERERMQGSKEAKRVDGGKILE